jgi:hypothetical protein
MTEKTWDQWIDCLGNKYEVGDLVAVATISGRSPQLVLAVVERINRRNSSGEEIMMNKSFILDEPIRHTKECYILKRKAEYERNRGYYYDRYAMEQAANHVCEPSCTEYWQKEEVRRVPSCTITARPVLDARGFGRYSTNADGVNKAVTYSIIENIILVEKRV